MINGNLIIRPLSAKLTHDTEHFGKMDPYVKAIVGSESKVTPAAKKQHMNPSWDSELVFRLNNNDVIYFEVYNKETLTKDDLIGSGSLFVSTFLNKGSFSEWLPLVYKDKPAGELLLEIQFLPDSGQMGAGQGISSKVGTTYSQVTYTQPTNLGTVGYDQGYGQGVGQGFTQPSTGYQSYGQQTSGYGQGTQFTQPSTGYQSYGQQPSGYGQGTQFTQPSTGQTFGQQSTGYTQGTNLPSSGFTQGTNLQGSNLPSSGTNQGTNQGYNQYK